MAKCLLRGMPNSRSLKSVDIGGTAFGRPRNFLGNRFVYLVLSQRAKGLSIGVNVNPGKQCNFKCVYCEVDRTKIALDLAVEFPVLAGELEDMLRRVDQKTIRDLEGFRQWPAELLELKEVAISGDGEPTLSPQFADVLEEVVGLRYRSLFPFFKIVVLTNTAGLPLPNVRKGLRLLSKSDEIWVKLEAGTQEYMDKINVPDLKLTTVLENIRDIARERPVVIQSLFPMIHGEEPSEAEIEQYVQRLQELKLAGAQISLVQIYSSHRPPQRPGCSHLPLGTLSRIARHVRTAAGLNAEVF